MREHWKRRHRLNQEAKSHHRKRSSRPLLPRLNSSRNKDSSSADATSSPELQRDGDGGSVENRKTHSGIPAQLFCGMSNALASSRPDPFQTCPVHLTSQHQKLLHHCASEDSKPCCLWKFANGVAGIGTHAAMMFEDLDVTTFNPMRDVWFPLDLSNASSFNCIMAHSAAHLSHLYTGTPPRRGTNSTDALKYKVEAVRILRLWLSDPEKELSDDSFSAVVRLLTFEVSSLTASLFVGFLLTTFLLSDTGVRCKIGKFTAMAYKE